MLKIIGGQYTPMIILKIKFSNEYKPDKYSILSQCLNYAVLLFFGKFTIQDTVRSHLLFNFRCMSNSKFRRHIFYVCIQIIAQKIFTIQENTQSLISNYIVVLIYIEGTCNLMTQFLDAFSIIFLVFNLCLPKLLLCKSSPYIYTRDLCQTLMLLRFKFQNFQ